MNTLVNVARYHLVDRLTWLALPWGIMAFSFLVNIGVALSVPASPHGIYTGGLVSLYIFMLLCGSLSMTRSLPFGLMMGISRRTYYARHRPARAGPGRGLRPRADPAAARGARHRAGGVSSCTTSGFRGSWTARGMRRG